MADMLEMFDDGTASFFTSSAENWWHKKGRNTGKVLTVEEAVETAELHRIYDLWPMLAYRDNEDGTRDIVEATDSFAVIGEHPKVGRTYHGKVGNRYSIIQIRQGFDVLNDICKMSGAHFETAGSIEGGNKVFMSMLLPDHMRYARADSDPIKLYLLAWNSFDGSQSFTLAATPVRPVCKNTVDIALAQAVRTFKIRHTESAPARMAEARDALGLVFAYQDALAEDIDRMLDKVYTDVQFNELVKQLMPIPEGPDVKEFVKKAQANRQAELRHVYRAPTQDGIRGTQWGALSAVIEWADFYSPVRAAKNKDTVRMEKVMQGMTAPIKQKAYALLKAS